MRVLLALLFFCGLWTSALAQDEKTLKAGDSLQISVWQDPKLDRKVVVGPDGMISFPLAGHIRASGLTAQGLEEALKSRLKKNYSGELDITVSFSDAREQKNPDDDESKARVFITGEVQKPGAYVLRPGTDVMQAIAQAGGLGNFAAGRRIQIHRKAKGVDTIFLFDFRAFESGAVATDNIGLRAGDIIIVPERGLLE